MRFKVLDGWRGICAILVALYHFPALGHHYLTSFVQSSYLFVDFFFVLSGFVITYAYADALRDVSSTKTFVLRRFARLWPLHAATLLVFIIMELGKALAVYRFHVPPDTLPFFGQNSSHAIITNIFLIQALGVHDTLTWNTPSWSISTEFYVYLVFAAVCLWSRTNFIRAAILTVLLSVAILVLFSPNYMNVSYDFGFFRCLFGFFVGVLAYRLFAANQPRGPSAGTATLLEIACIIIVIGFVTTSGQGWGSLLAPIVFSLIVLIFAWERGSISRMLTTPPFQLLGLMSYSIYMVHVLVSLSIERTVAMMQKVFKVELTTWGALDGHRRLFISFGSEWLMDALAVFFCLFVIALSYLTYKYIENPGRRMFMLPGRAVAPAA